MTIDLVSIIRGWSECDSTAAKWTALHMHTYWLHDFPGELSLPAPWGVREDAPRRSEGRQPGIS